jgi:hypothetical protein
MNPMTFRWILAACTILSSQISFGCPNLPPPVDTPLGLRYKADTALLTGEEYLLTCKTSPVTNETKKLSASQVAAVNAATAASSVTSSSFGAISSVFNNVGGSRSRGSATRNVTTQTQTANRYLVASADKFLLVASEISDGPKLTFVATTEPTGSNLELNGWASGLQSQLRQDYFFDSIQSISKSRNNSVSLGFDRNLSSSLSIGASIASDKQGISLQSLLLPNIAKSSGEGLSIAPYLSYQLAENVNIDSVLGIGTSSISGDQGTLRKSNRSFGGLNLTFSKPIENSLIELRLAILSARDRVSGQSIGNVDRSQVKASQIRLGANLTYLQSEFLPFLGINFVKDTDSPLVDSTISNSIGREALAARLGASYELKSIDMLASFFAEKEFRRDFQSTYLVSVNLRRKL